MTLHEQYRALKEEAVIGAVAAGSLIGVRGKDRASYLQGLLTNDILSLTPGTGCYAAWLTPQGRMLTDMHVFHMDEEMLLDVPADLASATMRRLDQSLFSEDVQLVDRSPTLQPVWVHGPNAPQVIHKVVDAVADLTAWTEYQSGRFEYRGSSIVLVRVSRLGMPGFGLYVPPPVEPDLRRALEAAGSSRAEPEVLEAARIEAGYPLFGVDMTADTIPLEAGIEDRAISFTKGCYVGQEVIIRVLHRGQGRVARKLVGLRIDEAVPARAAKILSDDREIGWITSAARSPRLGPVALGYVHRDFASPGTRLDVETTYGRMAASVSERRMSADAR